MIIEPILSYAHSLVEKALKPGDTAIDMTLGNGNDSLFLAKCVGEKGKIYGFDIQDDALHNAKFKIMESGISGENITLTCSCHSHWGSFVLPEDLEKVGAVLFNLGYLPGGDKTICTHENTTLLALGSLLEKLKTKAIIVLVCYPGHPQGAYESEAVLAFCKTISRKRGKVLRYELLNCEKPAPFVLAIELEKLT